MTSKGKGKMPVRAKEDVASPTKRPRMAENTNTTTRRPSVSSRGSHRDSDSEFTRQEGTVYDAVAGRVGHGGFIMDSHMKPVAPEEVLFRRQGAPLRYEENDPYWANRGLPLGTKFPDSDLLKIVHAYVSDFYGATDANESFESMDETALLAMGILLEETAKESLGKDGDLVFVEGEKKS